jgi:hypothetical protein
MIWLFTLVAMVAAPAAPVEESLADQVRALAAADPAERRAAEVTLMGLPPEELDELLAAAEAARPLTAAHRAPLRRVVRHLVHRQIYHDVLAETGGGFVSSGFLGVARTLDRFGDEQPGRVEGARVVKRLPGFAAYRYLRDNDVIVGMTQPVTRPIRDFDDLIANLRPLPAGINVTFRVRRDGVEQQITLRLDERPDNEQHPDFFFDQQRHSDRIATEGRRASAAVWQERFAPLFRRGD